MRQNPIHRLLSRQSAIIIDGGLATEIEARQHRLDTSLWSAQLLLEDPGVLRCVHADYLGAGADIIIAATYQATIEGFTGQVSREQAQRLLTDAVNLAHGARQSFWQREEKRPGRQRPLVAASIGPYGAYLADGSEYLGEYGLTEADLFDFHRERFHLLAQSPADLLACETIPSRLEAHALIRLLAELNDCWAWLTFTCRDGQHMADGTPLAEIATVADGAPQVAAVGVNCVSPDIVLEAVRTLRLATSKPIVVYPNSGETWNAAEKCWIPGSFRAGLSNSAKLWFEAGARLLGGCCRIGPLEIQFLREALLGTSSSSSQRAS